MINKTMKGRSCYNSDLKKKNFMKKENSVLFITEQLPNN